MKILVLNLGSTSTKLGVFEDTRLLLSHTLRHSREALAAFAGILDQRAFRQQVLVAWLSENNHGMDSFDVIAGTESRGFIFGMPIAYNLHKPFVLVRKKGKLPCETVSQTYDLEYGQATIEMHKDCIKPGQRVVIIDDLIATGGTVEAAIKLIEKLGGSVEKAVFLIELAGLKGRERLHGYEVESVLSYDGK